MASRLRIGAASARRSPGGQAAATAIDSSLSGPRNVPSTLLATILKTQNARYWLLTTWGIALIPVVGFTGVIWWVFTTAWAGWLRSQYEKAVAAKGAGWGRLPLVALSSAVFWASAPLLAWRAGGPFGHMLAWLMLASGYQLSFTQLGHTPRHALMVTLPYTAVVAYILIDLWGTPALPAAVLALGVLAGGLSFSVIYAHAAQQKITEGLRTDARLAMLRHQIQPHFLFNALNSVSGLIGEGRSAEAEGMLLNLAAFFRYSLTSAPTELTTLDEEIAGQRLYLAVEETRFSDRLAVRYDLDPLASQALVPSLILQPLVENAIIHGLSKSSETTTLVIGSKVRGHTVHVWVTDNAKNSGQHISSGLGIGLKNVRDRLEGHFNDSARLISGPHSAGWTAEIQLPFRICD